jgi:hypothetical protein
MTATKETKDKVDVLIQDDCCITISELCTAMEIGKLAIMAIIRELCYRKVCAGWVPKMLTVGHKTARKKICAELLQRSEKDRDASLSRIIIGDETWIHHYNPLRKYNQRTGIISRHHVRKN